MLHSRRTERGVCCQKLDSARAAAFSGELLWHAVFRALRVVRRREVLICPLQGAPAQPRQLLGARGRGLLRSTRLGASVCLLVTRHLKERARERQWKEEQSCAMSLRLHHARVVAARAFDSPRQ